LNGRELWIDPISERRWGFLFFYSSQLKAGGSPLGKYDSSITRVSPVFDRLYQMDKTGLTWLPKLLKLPEIPNHPSPEFEDTSSIIEARWENNEKPLSAPRSLVRWLIQNLFPPDRSNQKENEITKKKRQALKQKDPKVIQEALKLLEQTDLPERAWYILEGPSQPDVYLETGNMIVVIEGKRTEPIPTTTTKWMPARHQMLRHIDCSWEIKGSKRVCGFFIVEGDGRADAYEVPEQWTTASNETISEVALRRSLPHRKPEEVSEWPNPFLGSQHGKLSARNLG
jgi:hypothetical protein